jgi:transposase
MFKSNLKRSVSDKLIEHFVTGTTARCIADLVGVNHKTAAYYFPGLRQVIADQLERQSWEIFGGEIEVVPYKMIILTTSYGQLI